MADTVSLDPFVVQTITSYAQALRIRGVPFDKILVFGSHAKGTSTPKSDIDVCVISPTFGHDYHKALVSLLSSSIDIEGDLDIVPYTPSDLLDRYDPLATEIRTYGKFVV